MTDTPNDLPFIMARLRNLLDEFERSPLTPEWHLVIRTTYRSRADGTGVTLVVGTEPIAKDDDE